jgi:uncharacterized protein (DUF983 family)
MNITMFDFLGIVGVGIIVVVYFLLQIQKVNPKGFYFSFLNTIGSILIIISLLKTWNLASFIIEIFWLGISLFGVFMYFYRKQTSK